MRLNVRGSIKMQRMVTAIALGAVMLAAVPAAGETVKLVSGPDQPFSGPNLPGGGMIAQRVEAAYAAIGHEAGIDFMSWKRVEKAVQDGRATAGFAYYETAERRETYAFSDPINVLQEKIAVRPEDAGEFSSYSALHGDRTCYPLGWSFGSSRLNRMIEDGKVARNSPYDFSACLKQLNAGRIDFLVIDELAGRYHAEQVLGSADKLHFEELILSESGQHLIFDRDGADTEAEIARINEGIAAIRESGAYDEIARDFRRQIGTTE